MFRTVVPIAIGLVAVAALVVQYGTHRAREAALEELKPRLAAQSRFRVNLVRERQTTLRREVRFLANLPSIAGLVKDRSPSRKHGAQAALELTWKQHLEATLLGFAATDPEIVKLRFIGLADGGRELVRIDRHDSTVLAIPPQRLARDGDRDYFEAIASLQAGEVYLSELDLDREGGTPTLPHRLVLRAGTPIFDDQGILFGMVVVSIDAKPFLEAFQKNVLPPFGVYLTNARGEFLSNSGHPGIFDGFRPLRWEDEFARRGIADTEPRWIPRVGEDAGNVLAVGRQIPWDSETSVAPWYVWATYPDSALEARVSETRNIDILLAAGILGAGALLLWYYARHQREAKRRILSLNEELERQVRERTTELTQFAARQRAILANAGYAIISTDPDGLITLFNPAAEAMLGYAADDVVGRLTPLAFRAPEDIEARVAALSQERGEPVEPSFSILLAGAGADGPPIAREVTYLHRDGRRFPVLLTITSLRDESGTLLGYIGVSVDLTERRKFEEALRASTEAAVAANRSKADFLANMSHEIRTPMSAVLGLAYVLERRPLDPDSRELVRKLRRAGNSLRVLIDDVLDFSKIEGGHLELENVPYRLDDLLENLATIMGNTAGSKDLELAIGAPPAGAERLVGDAHRLEQILINLTGNAIKFTERGSVSVSIDLLSRTGDEMVLGFSVRDTGIGIPPDKIDGIFASFTQADTSTTRRFGGTGLGLAISRRLVEQMGGSIRVESEPGRGSHFRFTIATRAAAKEELDPGSLVHLDILVADDVELSRDAISSVAASMGWRPVAVDSGSEAIRETLERIGTEHPFDILLLDWKMPDLDGLATAIRLRTDLADRTPPIVLLATAYSREELANHPDSGKVDGILSKPVTGSSLYNAVVEATRRREEIAPLAAPGRARRLLGMRVLVVDDYEANRDLLRSIFVDEGAEVELAENGRAAVDWLEGHPDAVDIVLLDVQMPLMDGYTAARLLRANPLLSGLAIVALSAGVFEDEQDAALKAGMDAFVAKPFDVKELIETMLRLVGGKVATESVTTAGSPPPDEPTAPLDPARGIALWKSEAIYLRQLAKFAAEQRETAHELSALLEVGDVSGTSFVLHRLKGAAGVLQMPRLLAEIRRIEGVLRSGETPPASLDALHDALAATLAAAGALMEPGGGPTGSAETDPVTTPSPPDPGALLLALRIGLESDNRRRALAALDDLAGALSPARLEAIRRPLERFAFRDAEAALERIAAELANPDHPDPGKEGSA